MARNAGSFSKRQKERARQERQKAKVARRAEVKEMKKDRPSRQAGYDPDLEGIVPGPQPPLEE